MSHNKNIDELTIRVLTIRALMGTLGVIIGFALFFATGGTITLN
jgi:hypothetical protein